jgi:hypothetical protein
MSLPPESRREFVKKAAYVPPAIITLAAAPSFAKSGSAKDEDKDKGKGKGKDKDKDKP